ncbi:MAG: hypothetical protein Q9190_007869 [Brigantiaea leucoxantha]
MTQFSRRFTLLRPLFYTSAAALVGGTVLYISYRPRKIPGSDPASVPPPRWTEDGKFRVPRFPRVKSREEALKELRRSVTANEGLETGKSEREGIFVGLSGVTKSKKETENENNAGEIEPYDLLVIGGGATGSGIALDAATRGLKVALVEREDFASGTSSKSTKLVHGGVRYLEKAVWDLDYNQYSNRNHERIEYGKKDSG